MARRALRFLGAAVVTAVIYTGAYILIQSPKVLSAPETFIVNPQSQDGDAAGAPSRRAGPSGPSTPGARTWPDGTSTAPGGRARVASLRQAHEHDPVVLPLQSHAQSGGSSTAGARTRPGGASTAGAHAQSGARPGGASTADAHAQSGARTGGASTAGAYAQSDGAYRTATQPQGEGKGTVGCQDHHHCHCHWHNHPAPAPPPPPPPRTAAPPIASPTNKTEERSTRSTANRPMLVIGCLYSLLSFCSPVIIFWSTGRSREATNAFYGWSDLVASASSCLGWLLFALSQLHGEDGNVIGTTGVVVNAIGFALYAAYFVAKLFQLPRRDCLWVLLAFFGSYVVIVLVAVYGPMQRESKTALIISVVAFLLQIISQLIPLVTVCPLLWSMVHPPQIAQRPEHINSRKLTVFSRVGSFGLSLFWVAYCSMIHEHDYFQLANDVGAALSFMSMILHLVYTLRPHDLDYPPAP